MKRNIILILLSINVLLLFSQPKVLEKAYTYKNLTIYLLQSEDLVSREYITLEEAMKNKKIVLHETGSVGELKVDNKSDNYVFIMSGDIVKGGKQDRTISEDLVLKPKSKNVPLTSFCVERSRWQKRGSEKVTEFSSSSQMLSNRNLKIAARSSKSQGEVWAEVSNFQSKVGENINTDVQSRSSATSLQLSLENKDLQKTLNEYTSSLASAFNGKSNIVGFVSCINGKIAAAEWFGNASLAKKLQSKLLESVASEAIFLYDKDQKFKQCSASDVKTFLNEAEKGEESVSNTGNDMLLRQRKSDTSITFKSFNVSASEYPVHVSIYSTEDLKMSSKTDNIQQYQYGGYRSRNISNQ